MEILTPSTRALNLAKDSARKTVARAINSWVMSPLEKRSWAAVESAIGVKIPDNFKAEPIGRKSLELWGTWYVNSVGARLAAATATTKGELKQASSIVAKLDEVKELKTMGNFTLLPEQQAVYDAVVRDFFIDRKHRSCLQDGRTGSGKTLFAIAMIHHAIHCAEVKQSFYMFPVIIFCPPTLSEHWYRHIEQAGMGKYIGNTIKILPYSSLSATEGGVYIKEEITIDPFTGQERTKLKWNLGMRPFLAILDECHRVKNDSYQTRAILALLEHQPYTIWMSATPFVTVNDTRAFVISTRAKILDMQINEKNFTQFAALICREPAKPNLAAAKRLRELLAPFIYSFPKAKWAHKAINCTILVDFKTERDRVIYNLAYTTYKDKCTKLGKNTDFGRFEQFVALGQFRRTVEPLRMEQIVDMADKDIKSGKLAPVLGCAYRDSIIRAVFRLISLGYQRRDISIIWGGKDEIKQSMVLTPAEFDAMIKRIMSGEELSKHDLRKIEVTLRFKEEKANYSEDTDEETRERLRKVSEFGMMGAQTPNQRQTEIDRFQSGESKICLFTLAAGGVGLSLDHSRPNLLPRVGYFTPTYSGPEFQQALGRLARRMTLSDTRQYIVGMNGTIEESHVLPLIDNKLKCIAEITNSDYSLIDFHNARTGELHKLRSIDQAEKDAEDEKTQLHYNGDSAEEDDDESAETTT